MGKLAWILGAALVVAAIIYFWSYSVRPDFGRDWKVCSKQAVIRQGPSSGSSSPKIFSECMTEKGWVRDNNGRWYRP